MKMKRRRRNRRNKKKMMKMKRKEKKITSTSPTLNTRGSFTPPIPLAVVRVVSPPKNLRQRVGMSTGGKAPRSYLASRNLVANFRRRKKANERGSTPEWKPSKEKIEGNLWEDLAKSSRQFKRAYDLMMGLLQS